MKPVAVWIATLLAILALGAGAIACDTGSEFEAESPSSGDLWIHWNPAEGELPTPTDLVRNDETGRLELSADDDAPPAQQAFIDYLDGSDGYPLSTPIRVSVSGAIDENSLGRGIRVVRERDEERISVDSHYDDERGEIVVESRHGFEPGETYYVGVEGYTQGVGGVDGEMVVADEAFFLVRSTQSLAEHPDAVPGDDADERQQVADELAEIQEELAPVIDAMERQNIEREDLAVALKFTTTEAPAVAYDPVRRALPTPNEMLVDPDGDGLDLPVDDEMDEEEQITRRALSDRDGFANSAAIEVESTHDFGDDPSENNFRLFERDDDSGQWVEFDDLERGRLDAEDGIWARPELTLEAATDYVYVVTDDLKTTDGERHGAQPLGAVTRFDVPLVDDDGASLVDTLSDSEAARLEPMRQTTDEVLQLLEDDEGLDRERVAAAVAFRTQSTAAPLLERRAQHYEEDVTTEVTNLETTMPSGGAGLLLDNVDSVVRGEMTVLDHLDLDEQAAFDDGKAVERSVDFVLTMPEPGTTSVDEPVPVVLFGHGLMTSRELLYLIAGELASAGYAAFAFDFPYHGSRAICQVDDDCEGDATCEDEGQCRNADGTEADIKTIQVSTMLSFLEGTDYDDLLNYPITSGMTFIDLDNIVGTGDGFRQAILDLNQAMRVLLGDELEQAVIDETGLWIGDDIVYLGMSLGGILGSTITAAEPKLEDYVLNVPGADLARLIEHSDVFESMYENALEEREIEEGSDEYLEFINAARWVFDPIDPLNLVQFAIEDPIEYTDPLTGEPVDDRDVRVMIQMAEDETVVPNIGTEILSERMGVPYETYSPALTDHAFLFNPSTISGSATRQAREDLIEFFDNR